uniref:Rap guanine nucleotide exchange factor 3 n=1 Tax=Nomascus leucogenys TaxID=61853 RepID=G1S8B5_NOMLE
MAVGWPGESCWQVGLAVEESPALGAPRVGAPPDVVPEGTLLNMVLRRMHRPRSCSYQLLLEHQRPSCIQGLRWTPLTNSEESLDFSESLEQASTERVLRAGRQLHRHLLATCPNLIRDRKYHLRLYRLRLGGWCGSLHLEGPRFTVCSHPSCPCSPGQRTDEELDLIFEELLHIKAVAHLSNSVKRELAAVLQFEPHSKAGTVLFSQGDKGTSWYIIWKGSVNVVTHGKGLVTTLHEGDDFGQLALVNDAPRAATIILREDNCHFLRVDKQDFNRIIKDVEAKTMRLEEHGKVVLVLERASQGAGPSGPPTPGRNRYTVMSGTPEKILELLLEAMGPDSSAHDPTETFLSDFLLTHRVFMPSAQLCAALLHQYPSSPRGMVEQERSTYVCNKRQQILRLVSQWAALYGSMLHTDPVATSFLQKLLDLVGRDTRLSNLLREQWPERRRYHRLENGCGNASPQMKARNLPVWLPNQDEPLPGSSCAIRVGDKVPYDICRPDHSVLTLQLPVTASVREVMAALAQEDGWTKGQVLVKVNSAGGELCPWIDPKGGWPLGSAPRSPTLSHPQTPHPDQLGPTVGSAEGLDLVSAKDLAGQLTDRDWSLFNSIHQVELIHYVLGPQHLRDVTTANLERFMRRFNELQYWVATELCLCPVPGPRAQLLRKFIKLAAHLKEQKNLNSFFAVMFGLSNSAISRLAHTWERLPHKVRKLYSALERLLDPSWNHRVYRLASPKVWGPMNKTHLFADMTFIHEGNHTLVENLINFEKMRMMARAARMLHHCRSHNPGERGGRSPTLHPLSRVSHLHEDSQVVRISTCSEQSLSTRSPASTWASVQQLKVIDNQRELSRLSRELEP